MDQLLAELNIATVASLYEFCHIIVAFAFRPPGTGEIKKRYGMPWQHSVVISSGRSKRQFDLFVEHSCLTRLMLSPVK
jgi:hypothetical protein